MRTKVCHDFCDQSPAQPLRAWPGWYGPDGMGGVDLVWPPWSQIKIKEDSVAMAKVKIDSVSTKVFAGKVLAKGG